MLRGDEDCLPLSWQPKENLTMFTLSHLTLEKLFHTHSHLFVLSECLPLFQVAFPNPPSPSTTSSCLAAHLHINSVKNYD